MTAISNTLDLRFAVSDHVGNRAISDVFPRLIQMAETQLNQRLRTVWQQTDDTLTFSDGEADLPCDFLEMISMYGATGYQMRAGMRADQKRPGMSHTTYSIGDGKAYIRGFTGDRDILYYASIPTLTGSLNSSNWLLQRYPDVYLYAVGLQAAKFLKDVELSQATDQLLGFSLQAIKIDDERQRWSGAVVRVAAPTP
jgi:hypothetical protein